MDGVWQWGIDWIVMLQRTEGLATPMRLITFTGSTEFFLLILPALYWLVNRRLGRQMAVALLLSIWVGSVLKIALHSPRPYWIDPQVQLLSGPERTFGLPSIHALNGMVMWMLLAWHLQRWWAWLAAVLLTVLAGVARVYLGVHFPTDVLAGWLLGIGLLLAWWQWSRSISHWFSKFSVIQQILLGGIGSLLAIVVGISAQFFSAMTLNVIMIWPEAMRLRAEEYLGAFALTDIVTVAGFLLGLIAGLLLCEQRGGFEERAPAWQRVSRYLIGVVGVLLLWQGLDLLFATIAPDESLLGYTLRYIRYMLIGLWIFGLAPYFFGAYRSPGETE